MMKGGMDSGQLSLCLKTSPRHCIAKLLPLNIHSFG